LMEYAGQHLGAPRPRPQDPQHDHHRDAGGDGKAR
jgi:hypothetical protein